MSQVKTVDHDCARRMSPDLSKSGNSLGKYCQIQTPFLLGWLVLGSRGADNPRTGAPPFFIYLWMNLFKPHIIMSAYNNSFWQCLAELHETRRIIII